MKAVIEKSILKSKPTIGKHQLDLLLKHFVSGINHLAKERKLKADSICSELCDLIESRSQISVRLVFAAATNAARPKKTKTEEKPLSKMNKDELVAKAIAVGVDPESQDLTKLKNAELRDLIVSTIEDNG